MSTTEVSLRRQLTRHLLLPMLSLLLAAAGLTYVAGLSLSRDAYDRSLSDDTLSLVQFLNTRQGKITLDLPKVAGNLLTHDPQDRVYYRVSLLPGGQTLAATAPLPAPARINALLLDMPNYSDGVINGKPVRIASIVHRVAGPGSPLALVQMAETLNRRQSLIRTIIIGIAVPQLLLISMIGLLLRRGIRISLAPLDELAAQAATRSHIDLRPLRAELVPREVRGLVESINDLMGRLDVAISAQQRFIANAAHQLRTPLAGLKAHTELGLRQHTTDALRQQMQHIHGSVERSVRLVNQLLTLAQATPEQGHVPLARLELASLVRHHTALWVRPAMRKHIDLGYEGPDEGLAILGNDILLGELLNNLLDNAVRYTGEGGIVTVALQPLGQYARLSICDNGPGIADEEKQHIFIRFYRSQHTLEEGSGLGLSIVNEIAELHGTTVQVDDAPGGGSLFSMRFTLTD